MRTELAVTMLLVVGLAVAPVPVAAAEDPNFEVTVPEPTLTPGESAELTVVVTNDAEDADDQVEAAEAVEVTLHGADTPVSVQSGPRRLGTMADGDPREVTVRITVPWDIAAGTHDLSLRVAYEHDAEEAVQTVPVPVRVDDRAWFEVVDVTTDVSVGETGRYELTIRNAGSVTADDATVELVSQSGHVTFGGAAADTRYLGSVAPGEEATVEVPVAVAPDAGHQPSAATVTVTYEDADGIRTTAPPRSVGVTPAPERRFSVTELDVGLHVGEEGTVRGTLVNEGDRSVRDLVLELRPASPTLSVAEPEFAAGDLAAGGAVSFAFDVDVSSGATAGPRQFTLVPTFRTAAGDRHAADPLDLRGSVGPKRDAFRVGGVEAAFGIGDAGDLEIEVTNTRDERVTDVSAKLFTTAPLSTDDDEAFIPTLEPGESRRIVFGLAVGAGALAKTYPVEVDFRYRTAAGETRLSDTYAVPVEVSRAEGDGLGSIVVGGAVVGLVVAGLVGYLYRRRARPGG